MVSTIAQAGTVSACADRLLFAHLAANRSEPSFAVEPEWKPYYSARESYGSYLDPPIGPTDALDGAFWHRVTEAMETDE